MILTFFNLFLRLEIEQHFFLSKGVYVMGARCTLPLQWTCFGNGCVFCNGHVFGNGLQAGIIIYLDLHDTNFIFGLSTTPWLVIGLEVPPNILGTPKYRGTPRTHSGEGTPKLRYPLTFSQ